MALTQEERMGLIPLKTKAQINADVENLDSLLEKVVERSVQEQKGHVFAAAKNGFVTLSGYAPDQKTKAEIAHTVLAIPGVCCVTNHLKIQLDDT